MEEIGDRDEEMPVSWGKRFLEWFKWRKTHEDGEIFEGSARGQPEFIDHWIVNIFFCKNYRLPRRTKKMFEF